MQRTWRSYVHNAVASLNLIGTVQNERDVWYGCPHASILNAWLPAYLLAQANVIENSVRG